MRTRMILAASVFLLGAGSAFGPRDAMAQAPAAGTPPPTHGTHDAASQAPATSAFSPALVGSWTGEPDETELTTDLQVSVWGPNAKSVRNVELVVRPNGAGTLKVTTRVVDGKGRTVPASTSIEEAQLQVGGPQETIAGVRTEHAVKVLSAERRYPDDPASKWSLDGLRVKLATIQGEAGMLEVRVDTPEGRGSFWQALHSAKRAPRRSAR